MMDPGGGRTLLDKTEIKISEGHIYGLVGKNGFGKTTLLKQMASYEIEGYPNHIRMILVHQEEELSNYTVIESVLKGDEIRERLIVEEQRLTELANNTPEHDIQTHEEINTLLQMIWDLHEDTNF